jgi:hypothetical protein
MLPVYDSGDDLHPNDAGMRAMAEAIALRLFRQDARPAQAALWVPETPSTRRYLQFSGAGEEYDGYARMSDRAAATVPPGTGERCRTRSSAPASVSLICPYRGKDLTLSGVLILLGGFAGAGQEPGSLPWLTRSGTDWKRPTVQACPGDAGART